jgi:GT2 family glycosyltransferase
MSASLPRVSVVIVTWNALPLLKRFLPSVVATDYPDLEIILADNASTDGSATFVREHFPSVKIVRHPANWRFCRGNNAALPHATGRYVALLNNDVAVPPGWLHPLVHLMEKRPGVAAAQPKLLQNGNADRFEYAGAAGGFLDRAGYPFARGRLLETLEADRGQYDNAREVFWATGAAMLLRRSALEGGSRAVGLLDETFEMHMEEIDLCWRLWRAGWRVRVEPTSTVRHLGGSSLPQGSPQKAYYNFRNSLLMLYKHLPPRRWRRTFALRAGLDAAAATRRAAQGRLGEARAVARAYRDAHRLKDEYAGQRPASDAQTILPPYRGLVAADYFLHGRRRFSALPVERFRAPWRRAGR